MPRTPSTPWLLASSISGDLRGSTSTILCPFSSSRLVAKCSAVDRPAPPWLRFRQLQRAVGGVSQRMLTLTVRRLERDGLVRRTVYPTVPAQVDYRLTEMGASLTHLLRTLADWSLAHRKDIAQAQTDYDRAHAGRPIR